MQIPTSGAEAELAPEPGPADKMRAEFAEIATIAAQAARLGVTVDAADAMRKGVSPDALRRSVLDTLAARDRGDERYCGGPVDAHRRRQPNRATRQGARRGGARLTGSPRRKP